jgi:hypothetical protein
MRQWKAIRDVLAADGIAARIDALVSRSLGGGSAGAIIGAQPRTRGTAVTTLVLSAGMPIATATRRLAAPRCDGSEL